MTGPVLALDLGGTKIAGAWCEQGRLRHQVSLETCVDNRPDPGGIVTSAVVERLLQVAPEGPFGVGVVIPEYVRPATTTAPAQVTSAQVLPDIAVAIEEVGRLTGVEPSVESDVRAAALAHAHWGSPRWASFLFVSWGTGVSSAWVVNGQVWAGARGEALALGEIGGTSPLEPEVSGAGLASQHPGDPGEWIAVGDQAGLSLLARAGERLGEVLAGLVAVLDPHAVILGGGLGTAIGPHLNACFATFDSHTPRPGRPPLLSTNLGPAAGLLGAGLVGRSELHSTR